MPSTRRTDDAEAVVQLEVAVHDHGVAIEPANDDVVSRHFDLFVVHTRRDEDEVSLFGCVDCVLNGRIVLRNVANDATGLDRLRIFGVTGSSTRRERDDSDCADQGES